MLHSVRLRLALMFTAILAVVLAGFSLFIYTRQAQVLRAGAGSRLASQEARLQPLLDPDREKEPGAFVFPFQNTLLLDERDSLALVGPDGRFIQMEGSLSSDNLAHVVAEWQRRDQPAEPISMKLAGKDDEFLTLVTPMRGEHGRIALLVLAGPVDPGRQLPLLALTLAGGSALLLLLSLGGGFWLADRLMRPVQAITRTAREIGAGDLRRRLNLRRQDELGELADTFDQMLERLEAAFDRQRRFTADASHELRTPLAIIELEVTRVLERRRSAQEYEQTLALVRSENEWMASLVNELLTLARLDEGQVARQRQPLDLSELAVGAIERLTPLARQKGVGLQAARIDDTPVLGDRAYLSQMLFNLVENAIKYAGTGAGQEEPCVRIETRPETRDGLSGGRLDVVDNGPGIPADHLPHLFERFYRVDAARTRDADSDPESAAIGTGLGLAIVQAIVQAHDGIISVDSRPGEGTVFTVWLPGPQ